MRDEHPNEQLKIELLSQWKLEAESRKIQLPTSCHVRAQLPQYTTTHNVIAVGLQAQISVCTLPSLCACSSVETVLED